MERPADISPLTVQVHHIESVFINIVDIIIIIIIIHLIIKVIIAVDRLVVALLALTWPEAQKPKTFQIAAFHAQNFTGRSAQIQFARHIKKGFKALRL